MNRVDYACAVERTRPQRLRALRRFFRDLWRFLSAPRCEL